MKDVYLRNPQMGDPASLDHKLTEVSQNIEKLRLETQKFEVQERGAWGGRVRREMVVMAGGPSSGMGQLGPGQDPASMSWLTAQSGFASQQCSGAPGPFPALAQACWRPRPSLGGALQGTCSVLFGAWEVWGLGTRPGSAQGPSLALCSGVTPDDLWGPGCGAGDPPAVSHVGSMQGRGALGPHWEEG